MATEEPVAQKGKAKLTRGGLGRYTVTDGLQEVGHDSLLAAWCDYLPKTGWTDAQPPDTKRR